MSIGGVRGRSCRKGQDQEQEQGQEKEHLYRAAGGERVQELRAGDADFWGIIGFTV